MAKTTIPIELSSTPSIVDGGNATAITIDSSENVTFAGGLVIPSTITHAGDTDTKLDFNQANTLRLITGDNTAWICSASSMVINEDSIDFDFRVESNGNANMLFVDGGNDYVSIGASTDLTGALNITHGSEFGLVTSGGYNYQAKFESTDAEAAIVIEDSNSGTDYNRIGVITNDMAFTTNNSERMRIDSSGDVQIGGVSHQALSGSARELTIGTTGDTANDGGGISFTHNGALGSYVLGQKGSMTIAHYTDGSPILFRTNNGGSQGERMFLASTGELHIGHTQRSAYDSLGTLVVQQLDSGKGIGVINTGANNTFQMRNESNVGILNHNLASAQIKIGTNDTTDLIIDGSSGKVGIGGNFTPANLLEIQGGGYDQIRIGSNHTDNTNKTAGIVSTMYTNNSVSFMQGFFQNGNNSVYYGSADSAHRGLQNHYFYVNSNYNATSGHTLAMQINSSGIVTKPLHPSFEAAGVAGGGSGQINFTTTYVNVGGYFSTSTDRFTAPVAGNYLFYTNYIKNNQATTTNRRRFLKNGSTVGGGRHIRLGGENGGNYDWGSLSQIITLAANDYVTVDHYAGNTYGSDEYDCFGGYLIG